MLNEVYKGYKRSADLIDWKKYSINDLFFEYIKHENDELRDNFYAGIVCRVWGYSGRVYIQCNKHVPFDQCYDVIIDTINYVIKKRVWEDPNSSLYQDKTAPDKAFHMVLKRQRSVLLSNLTAYKRKTNFNTLSIDGAHEEYNDAAEGLLFNDDTSEGTRNIMVMISEFFEKGDYFSGLFLDVICFGNYDTLNYSKIISMVKDLNEDDYNNYYSVVYKINKKEYNKELYNIRNTSSRMNNIKLRRLLYNIKESF